jgi:hypothetical protein
LFPLIIVGLKLKLRFIKKPLAPALIQGGAAEI